MKLECLIILVSLMFFLSCSSPYSDGEKAAKTFNEAEEMFQVDLRNKVGEYIENFDLYGFTSRVEARRKINALVLDVRRTYDNNMRNAQLLYINLKNHNSSKFENAQSFEEGFEKNRKYLSIDTSSHNPIFAEINTLIKTIIPPKPSVNKIKSDLTGHFWQDTEDGYFGTKKQVIKEETVKDINIISEASQPDTYFINAELSVQERKGSATFKINSDIKYILGDGDDWNIDYLGSNSVDIVRTGQFDKYIRTELIDPWLKWQLEITNSSDATLIVGGILLDNFSCQWNKFSVEIAPNSTNTIGGMYSTPHYGSILEYEIHFVERK